MIEKFYVMSEYGKHMAYQAGADKELIWGNTARIQESIIYISKGIRISRSTKTALERMRSGNYKKNLESAKQFRQDFELLPEKLIIICDDIDYDRIDALAWNVVHSSPDIGLYSGLFTFPNHEIQMYPEFQRLIEQHKLDIFGELGT